MALMIITTLFLLLYAALIFFYYRQWKAVPCYVAGTNVPTVFISVVIAARNEESTLPLLIADLLLQTYPQALFEVLIVNDYSTDGTAAVGESLEGSNMRMVLPDSAPEASSKKAAITTGVVQARGELIVVTDADCRVGPDWLLTIASFYTEHQPVMIAAPVQYTGGPQWLSYFQCLDFITLQGITAAAMHSRFHYMGNGANLAYTRAAFTGVGGFAGIDSLPTGDDMLLMHKLVKQHPQGVLYLKSKAAIVYTAPAPTLNQFLQQRRRWASKTLVYTDWKIIAVLFFVLLLNLLFFVLLTACFFKPANAWLLLLFIAGKTVIEWPFVSSVATFYGQRKLMKYFALFQPVHFFYTVVVGLWSQVGGYEWKGRKVKKA